MAEWDSKDWSKFFQDQKRNNALQENANNTRRIAEAEEQKAKASLIEAEAVASAQKVRTQIEVEKYNTQKELKNAKNKLAKYHSFFEVDVKDYSDLSANEFLEIIENKTQFNAEKSQLVKSLEHEDNMNEIRLLNNLISDIESKIKQIEKHETFQFIENLKKHISGTSQRNDLLNDSITLKNKLESECNEIKKKLISLAEDLHFSHNRLFSRTDFLELSEPSYTEKFKPLLSNYSKWQAVTILSILIYAVSLSLYSFVLTIPIFIITFLAIAKLISTSAALKKVHKSLEDDLFTFTRLNELDNEIPKLSLSIDSLTTELKDTHEKIETQKNDFIKFKKISNDALNNIEFEFRNNLKRI